MYINSIFDCFHNGKKLVTIFPLESSKITAGADPAGLDGVANHPPFQMKKKKNKESGFSSNFILN